MSAIKTTIARPSVNRALKHIVVQSVGYEQCYKLLSVYNCYKSARKSHRRTRRRHIECIANPATDGIDTHTLKLKLQNMKNIYHHKIILKNYRERAEEAA